MHIRHIYVSRKRLLAYEIRGFKGWKNVRLYLHRLVRACLKATRLHVSVRRPSYSEPTDAGTAWMPHDTTARILVEGSINRAHYAYAGGKARHWRNGAIPKAAAE